MAFRLSLFYLWIGFTTGFVLPQPFLSTTSTSLPSVPFLLADNGVIEAVNPPFLEQAGGIVSNILIGLTAIAFLLAGLTFVYASYIIPEAAKQLEREAEELAPDLLQQTQAKLEEGETLAMRPDLMQDLGSQMQPLIERKLEAQFQEGASRPKSTTSDATGKIVDAEIVKEDDTTQE